VQAAVLPSQRTAGNRKYTAKTAKEPSWPQSKRKTSATFRKTTAAFRRQKYLYNRR